jgi:hypothetical protein
METPSWGLQATSCLASIALGAVVICAGLYATAVTVQPPSPFVPNRTTCECDCWDRAFKGIYYHSHVIQYKSVYFNMTWNTAYLFLWSLLHFVLLLKYIEWVVALFWTGRVRWLALILTGVSYYQMFYNWWATFNYINDSWYGLLPTQMFFNVTELIPALIIAPYANANYIMNNSTLRTLGLSVALAHMYLALGDQGWAHLFQQALDQKSPFAFLKIRDGMFVLGDTATVVILVLWGSRGHRSRIPFFVTLGVLTGTWVGIYVCMKQVYGYQ